MTERGEIIRELLHRAAIGFPGGVTLVYLLFLLGGLYDSFLSKVMACLICLFVAVYSIAWRVLNKRM